VYHCLSQRQDELYYYYYYINRTGIQNRVEDRDRQTVREQSTRATTQNRKNITQSRIVIKFSPS